LDGGKVDFGGVEKEQRQSINDITPLGEGFNDFMMTSKKLAISK